MTIRDHRRRVPLLAAGLTLTCLTACDSSAERPEPAARVVAHRDLGVVETNPAITARDVGLSVPVDDRSVWIYGDTFLASPDESGRTLISDSWSWTYDLDAGNGVTSFFESLDSASAPRKLLPETDAERRFNEAHLGETCAEPPCGARWGQWPTSAVNDEASNRVLIFYSLVYAEPGAFNFSGHGTSVAIWDDQDQAPQRPTLDPLADHPTMLFDRSEPAFGSAAFIDGGMLFAYGCKLKDYEKACKLGRVPLERVLERRAWEYYAGDGWTSNIDHARTVFNGNDLMSVSWNEYLGQYLAVYSRAFSNTVVMRTAPSPEGPWSGEEELFVAERPAQGQYTYDALAHREYARDDGRVLYVTYSRATAPFASELRLVEVELARPQ